MVPFSERLFMNRKIKAYQAIIYIVLFYLAAVLFLLGPGKLLEKDRLLAGAENPVGTVEVREDQQVQQVLIAEGDYLRYLELYVTSPKSPGEYYHLLVYDENNEMLINRDFELKADEVPGFVQIPLGIDTTRGRLMSGSCRVSRSRWSFLMKIQGKRG